MIDLPKQGDPSLVYMYGLSDFWVDMFGDDQLVETLLAGETIKLGEAYSYFLQRAAGVSLTDIQERYSTRIKLLLLKKDDLVDSGDLSRFRVDESILSMSKMANRPILPTQTLDYGVHFDISDNVLTFHKPIDEMRFPVRYESNGDWQYAVWMTDVEVNEKWIENSFGRLVGFKEEDAIFNYKSFLEGVYFLYTNGPNISFIERGVNLAMGMPYARATEEVLEIFQDEISGNYVVFTSSQSYEIPYSFQPNLVVGDVLQEGKVITTWVEVLDYSSSGAWWYQIYLPRDVLGPDVDPIALGKAIEGSPADGMMKDFLKHHMFEVLITQPSSDGTAFNTARDLVLRAKPEYTFPVFVWKASVTDEIINLSDDFSYLYKADRSDHCIHPPSIRFMDRGMEESGFVRGTHWYNRVQGSVYAASLLGYGDWQGNGGWAPEFDSIDEKYSRYMATTIRGRGDNVTPRDRGVITRGWRGDSTYCHEELIWEVKAPNVYGGDKQPVSFSDRSLTPLYMMSTSELVDKMLTVDRTFKLSNQNRIAVKGINLVAQYDTWMKRNDSIEGGEDREFHFEDSIGDLDIALSTFAYQTYVPRLDEMYDSDDLPILDGEIFITRSTGNSWVCQWVRRDLVKSPTIFPVEDQDHTQAIETYDMTDVGKMTSNYGVAILKGERKAQSVKLARGPKDLLLVVDGKYVSSLEYTTHTENTKYATNVYPFTEDLPSADRSYASLIDPPVSYGYLVYDRGSDKDTVDEVLVGTNGVFTLSEEVQSNLDVLVTVDGDFIFDFVALGTTLTMDDTSVNQIIVRYVAHTREEVFSAGSSTYTLNNSGHCKIFIGSKLMEEWSIKRTGTILELPSVATEDLTVRYSDGNNYTLDSLFNRSTVERNQARFLMDRSREDGEYDDYLGQTVFMNRGGIPSLRDGSLADSVNITRRLR